MKKVKLISVILCALFVLGGCNAVFVKKDSLVFIQEDDDENNGILTLEVTSFEEESRDLLLYYDSELNLGIYTERESLAKKATSYLYLNDESGEHLLFSGINSYTYAYIDPYDKSIYFKEYNSADATTILYKTDYSVSSKTMIALSDNNKSLPCAAANGAVAYVDANNDIVMEKNAQRTTILSLMESSVVKKIAYSPSNNAIVALVSVSQRSSILYLIDIETGELTQLDAGVSDFSHEENQNKLYYVKSAGGKDQLYTYNYQTAIRNLLYTGSIDCFAVSPKGSYVAFCTRTTVDSPGQSVWLLPSANLTAMQMTASTSLVGSMYFASGQKLLFSEIDTHNQNTEYITKKLEFKIVYSERGTN